MTAVSFRDATRADVPAIVALLTDDPLGRGREGADPQAYLAAFADIAANPMHQLIVGEAAGRIVACAQLTVLAGLSRGGSRRALVEAVRVVADLRSQGVGAALMAECEVRARAAGCTIIQLTTDKSRHDAHRFYDRLGFETSHLGMKKPLT
ncbi:GNAT family N-acetyltransferase [Tabrizicola sp.]|jgi:GNAT superfamily N-acetyltransferase|uniref:GNAT family N-acetyltransferase n=1 Tax=Tabrizicola sp. TaxID=2005166 RepID=UPI001A53CA36|nr:GNAT family N-acetyltransferase [Tabrizicola sp.]MBL9075144.1 GNAT family N-acetyltransferase [Tabrizicola sp.]